MRRDTGAKGIGLLSGLPTSRLTLLLQHPLIQKDPISVQVRSHSPPKLKDPPPTGSGLILASRPCRIWSSSSLAETPLHHSASATKNILPAHTAH